MTDAPALHGDDVAVVDLGIEQAQLTACWPVLSGLTRLHGSGGEDRWRWTARRLDADADRREVNFALHARTADGLGYANGSLRVSVADARIALAVRVRPLGTADTDAARRTLVEAVAAELTSGLRAGLARSAPERAALADVDRPSRRRAVIGAVVVAGAALAAARWLRRNPEPRRRWQ